MNTQTTNDDAPLFEGFIDETEYCRQRRISRRTAQRERRLREGPPYVRLGHRVYYRVEAVQGWVLQKETVPLRTRSNPRGARR